MLVLYHPSPSVVLFALDLFAASGRTDYGSVARRLLRSDDPEIRAAALRALAALRTDPGVLRRALTEDDPLLHATALVGLISASEHTDEELMEDLEQHVAEDGHEVKRALASAIRYQRDPRFSEVLVELSQTSMETEVQIEVLRAMAAIPDELYLPTLLHMLSMSRLRPWARDAIVPIGDPALDFLSDALRDVNVPRKIRRHIPRTVSRFEPRKAAAILEEQLRTNDDGAVRFKILRGLGRLRAENPELSLDRRLLRDMSRTTLHRAIQMLDWRIAAAAAQTARPELATRGGELLVAVLREKEQNAIERLFRILGLLHPEEDFELLYKSAVRADARQRAQSRELLANVVESSIRGGLVALLDEGSDAERLAAAENATGYSPSTPRYEDGLIAMLEDSSEAVQSVAAYHIAELGLTDLVSELRHARTRTESFLGDVIDRALGMLGQPLVEEGTHAA